MSLPGFNIATNRDLLIDAKGVSLHLPVVHPETRAILSSPQRIFRDLYLMRKKRSYMTVIDDINLEVRAGDRIGLIGPNGSGKSTLLRLLAGIFKPSSGELTVNGKITGMFDVSMGLLNEATGMENILLRGLQLGLGLRQTQKIAPEIIAFSELGEHINKPIDKYSTGMRVRLAFSIATIIDPDILLLDEWIGAGDADFVEKARTHMIDKMASSRGLILASHNHNIINTVCNKIIKLDEGRLIQIR